LENGLEKFDDKKAKNEKPLKDEEDSYDKKGKKM
jgi:hypothetical protein